MAEVLSLVIFAAGVVVWWCRLRPWTSSPAEVSAEPAGGGPLPVSIVVPARNEAHNLPALLASLARLDPAPLEVIVVDDHSTDDTAAVAAAGGARVVTPPPLPPGWLGKSWACRAGARAARGALLLFTDADTVHAPDSLGRAAAALYEREADLLSVVPTHQVVARWERLQGIFQLLLLVATRAGGRARRGERRFSIGQYLLFRRDAYEWIGGHELVRDRVAEDLALARLMVERGGRFELLAAEGVVSVRMYPEGLGAFVRGWRRSFREGIAAAGAGGVLEVAAVIGWLLGVPTALAGAALAGDPVATGAWAAAYLATAAEIARRQRRLGAFRAPDAILYPVFTVLFVWISALAVYDRLRRAPVRWKERSISLDPGESAR
jgi:4,4'-diaponeurosporenoate glycosyltransferase